MRRKLLVAVVWWLLLAAIALADGEVVALLDTGPHGEMMQQVFAEEGVPFAYYDLADMTVEAAMAQARQDGAIIIAFPYVLGHNYSQLHHEMKLAAEAGITVYIPAGYAGDTILEKYREYSIIVGAQDEYGHKRDDLNNGPEIAQYTYGCYLGQCSTSVATVRAAAEKYREMMADSPAPVAEAAFQTETAAAPPVESVAAPAEENGAAEIPPQAEPAEVASAPVEQQPAALPSRLPTTGLTLNMPFMLGLILLAAFFSGRRLFLIWRG